MDKNRRPRTFDFYPLEDRLLLSGEGVEGLQEAPDIDADLTTALLAEMSPAGQVPEDSQVAAAPTSTVTMAEDATGVDDMGDMLTFDPALPLQVVFVNPQADDAETLLDSLRDKHTEQTQWFVVELSADQDGIAQITSVLSQLQGVDAVHLISHRDGEGLILGNSLLTLTSVPSYVGEIASWGHALDGDGELLIYGVDLASTTEGQDLIEMLGIVCDCDVIDHDSEGQPAFHPQGDAQLEAASGEMSTILIDQDAATSEATTEIWFDADSTTPNFERVELVFLDTGVQDYSQILADLQSQAEPGVRLEVALIDQGDGLVQINHRLAELDRPVDAIHFIVHGTDRAFNWAIRGLMPPYLLRDSPSSGSGQAH